MFLDVSLDLVFARSVGLTNFDSDLGSGSLWLAGYFAGDIETELVFERVNNHL